jgi:hypothetical protein
MPGYKVGGSNNFGVALNVDSTGADKIAVPLISPISFKISKLNINLLIFTHKLCNTEP